MSLKHRAVIVSFAGAPRLHRRGREDRFSPTHALTGSRTNEHNLPLALSRAVGRCPKSVVAQARLDRIFRWSAHPRDSGCDGPALPRWV